jgi:hypothetical protein
MILHLPQGAPLATSFSRLIQFLALAGLVYLYETTRGTQLSPWMSLMFKVGAKLLNSWHSMAATSDVCGHEGAVLAMPKNRSWVKLGMLLAPNICRGQMQAWTKVSRSRQSSLRGRAVWVK